MNIITKTAAFTIADADLDTDDEVLYMCTGAFAITIPATGVAAGGKFGVKSTDGLQTFTTTGATVTPPQFMSVALYGDEASVGITCTSTGNYEIVGDLASSYTALSTAVFFEASNNTNTNLTTTAATKVELDDFVQDNCGCFDNTTDTFTAPVAGNYHFEVNVRIGTLTDQDNLLVVLKKNGTAATYNVANQTYSGAYGGAIKLLGGVTLQLEADDTIELYARNYSSTVSAVSAEAPAPVLRGFLLDQGIVLAPHGVDHAFAVSLDNGADKTPSAFDTYVKVPFDTIVKQTNIAFDTANNRFVAPTKGWYQFNANVQFNTLAVDDIYTVALYVDGASVASQDKRECSVAGNNRSGISKEIYLLAGQYVEVFGYHGGTTGGTFDSNPIHTWFSGHKVSGTSTGVEYDSYDVAFRAKLSATQTGVTNAATKVEFDSVDATGLEYDKGGNFDTTNHQFVVPVDGVYNFQASVNPTAIADQTRILVYIYADTRIIAVGETPVSAATSSNTVASCAGSMYLEEGDTVYVSQTLLNGTTSTTIQSGGTTYFSGQLIHATTKAECSFAAYQTSAQSIPTGTTFTSVEWDGETEDVGGNFSVVNNSFTAPEDGLYQMDLTFLWADTLTDGARCDAQFLIDPADGGSNKVRYPRTVAVTNSLTTGTATGKLRLKKDDVVYAQVRHWDTGSHSSYAAGQWTMWSGYRLTTTPTTDTYNPVVWETTIATATDTVNVPSGLLGGTDYRVELAWVDPTTSSSICYLYINDDTTGSNYNRTHQFASSATPQSAENTDAFIGVTSTTADDTTVSKGTITVIGGNYHGRFQYSRPVSGAMVGDVAIMNTTTTMNTITDIQFKSSVAASFGVGTRIRILRD